MKAAKKSWLRHAAESVKRGDKRKGRGGDTAVDESKNKRQIVWQAGKVRFQFD